MNPKFTKVAVEIIEMTQNIGDNPPGTQAGLVFESAEKIKDLFESFLTEVDQETANWQWWEARDRLKSLFNFNRSY